MAINGHNDESVIYTLDPCVESGLEWDDDVDQGNSAAVYFGPEFEPDSPMAVVFSLRPGSADPLRAMHRHGADAINLIVRGALKMDGVWLTAGMMKCTPAGVPYGDAEVGPDGCTFIEFLAHRGGVQQTYVDPQLQRYFEQHAHLQLTGEIAAGLREGNRVKPGSHLETH